MQLLKATDAFRLHDVDADALYRSTIECFGDYAVVNSYDAPDGEVRAVATALTELGARGVYLKQRPRSDLRKTSRAQTAPSRPIAGEPAPEEHQVTENGLRYWVRMADGLSTGLFLDQRESRRYLRMHSQGATVLNLFCYTGSFSVAAGVGGAQEVTSVDLSGAVLRRVNANIALNGQRPESHRLRKADAGVWLTRAEKRGDQFDWIIVDPPSFASMGKKTFSVAKDYERLARQCLALLSSGGRLIAVTNHRRTARTDFQQLLGHALQATGRRGSLTWLPAPADCPVEPQPDLATKTMLVTLHER